MLLIAGLVLLALGIFCGAMLVAAPLGLVPAGVNMTLWLLFPAFTIGGYLLAAAPATNKSLPMLSRVSGVLLVLLALAAAIALVLQASAIIEPSGGTMSLWYVLIVGLVLGGTGIASHTRMADT